MLTGYQRGLLKTLIFAEAEYIEARRNMQEARDVFDGEQLKVSAADQKLAEAQERVADEFGIAI